TVIRKYAAWFALAVAAGALVVTRHTAADDPLADAKAAKPAVPAPAVPAAATPATAVKGAKPSKPAAAPAKPPAAAASAKPSAKPGGGATPKPGAAAPSTKPAVTKAVAQKEAAPPKRSAATDKFLLEQRQLLLEERGTHMRQAESLKEEADALAAEMEPGESEFGEEGGEGGNLSIERELDLVLSAQAKAAVDEIDRALAKIGAGTYGLCEKCGKEIPRARLKALPHAPLCVACKSGGLSSRR
ncbi:MAG TPA: TraR/DksA C4-type zinc finger protein, partial [Acidimicrobiales bacterium]|nr:TraR/DksA C4-type zinc finger protein [Acidimicrobiales bacterium]